MRTAALSAALALVSGVVALSCGIPAAGAAPRPTACSYSVSGNVSPSTASAGQTIRATASVLPSRSNCSPTTVTIRLTGGVLRQLGSCNVPSTGIVCVVSFVANEGVGVVEAAVPGQSTVSIGTVTVVGSATTTTKTVAPPPTKTQTVPRVAPTTAARTTARPKPTVTRTNPALKLPDSPWTTGELPSAAPLAVGTADPSEEGIPLSTEVTHGSGGMSVPVGLLLVSVIVLAGLFGAVVRLVVAHTHEQVGP